MQLFRRRPRRDSRAQMVSDDEVLDVTVRQLARNPNATFADIGRRARIDDKEMRERFTSLDELIGLAIMRGARRISRSAFLEDGTPVEQVALLVARLWDDQQPVAPFALRGVHGPLRAKIETTLTPVRELAADAVARGAKEGTLRSDIAPEAVAWLIEQCIVTCLEYGVREGLTPSQGRLFTMHQALSVAGLSWTEARDVVGAVSTRLR